MADFRLAPEPVRPTKIEIVLAGKTRAPAPTSSGRQAVVVSKLEQKEERLWLAEFDESSSSSSSSELQFNELLACQSGGSWPPAKLVWSLGTTSRDNAANEIAVVELKNQTETISSGEQISRSPLRLTYAGSSAADESTTVKIDSRLDGLEFVCLATNEHLLSSSQKTATLEARLRISVRCKLCLCDQTRIRQDRTRDRC